MYYKYKHTIKEIQELFDRVFQDKELCGEIFDISRNKDVKRVSEVFSLISEVYPKWSFDQRYDLTHYMINNYEYKNKKNYYSDPL